MTTSLSIIVFGHHWWSSMMFCVFTCTCLVVSCRLYYQVIFLLQLQYSTVLLHISNKQYNVLSCVSYSKSIINRSQAGGDFGELLRFIELNVCGRIYVVFVFWRIQAKFKTCFLSSFPSIIIILYHLGIPLIAAKWLLLSWWMLHFNEATSWHVHVQYIHCVVKQG